MKWTSIFKPVKSLSPDEVREFMASRRAGDYQLLDVRQPSEYERGHISGAQLIPIKQLSERIDELDPKKPVLAYCAVGGRSRAAAQLLSGKGFSEVYNMRGGIKAWDGLQATGPELAGLDLILPENDYVSSLTMGYALEDGLQRFYRELAEKVEDPEQKRLLERLAGFEDKHKAWLAEEYETVRQEATELPPLAAGESELMEGGRAISQVMARVRPELLSLEAIFDLSMMFETQAMDLYGRLAQKAQRQDVRELFLRLVDEEKMHLGYLEKEMTRMLGGGQ